MLLVATPVTVVVVAGVTPPAMPVLTVLPASPRGAAGCAERKAARTLRIRASRAERSSHVAPGVIVSYREQGRLDLGDHVPILRVGFVRLPVLIHVCNHTFTCYSTCK